MYQRLAGEVKRLVGKKGISEAQVLMHVPMEKVLEKTVTDQQGQFEFGHFEFPDSTQYNLQALTAKNGDKVLLSLREETFPAVNEVWPLGLKSKSHDPQINDQPVSVEFMDKSGKKMEYVNGMRNVFLEEVVVTAKKREVPQTPYEGMIGGMTLKRKDIEETPMIDLRTFIRSRFLGVYFEGDAPYYHQKPISFYAPKYETKYQKEGLDPDLRTTLYWNPKVQTDEQGNASVEFYTADSEAGFSVVVEGVTDEGKLIRAVKRF